MRSRRRAERTRARRKAKRTRESRGSTLVSFRAHTQPACAPVRLRDAAVCLPTGARPTRLRRVSSAAGSGSSRGAMRGRADHTAHASHVPPAIKDAVACRPW
jgi:hypothetical protein